MRFGRWSAALPANGSRDECPPRGARALTHHAVLDTGAGSTAISEEAAEEARLRGAATKFRAHWAPRFPGAQAKLAVVPLTVKIAGFTVDVQASIDETLNGRIAVLVGRDVLDPMFVEGFSIGGPEACEACSCREAIAHQQCVEECWARERRQAEAVQGAVGWEGDDDLDHALCAPAQSTRRLCADGCTRTLQEAEAANDGGRSVWLYGCGWPAQDGGVVGRGAGWQPQLPPSPAETAQRCHRRDRYRKQRVEREHPRRELPWQPRQAGLTLEAAVWAAFGQYTVRDYDHSEEEGFTASETDGEGENSGAEADETEDRILRRWQRQVGRLQAERGQLWAQNGRLRRRLRSHGDDGDAGDEPAPGPMAATDAYSTGYRDGEGAAKSEAGDALERHQAAASAMAAQWDQDKQRLARVLREGVTMLSDADARACELERRLPFGGPAEQRRTVHAGEAQLQLEDCAVKSVAEWLLTAREWLPRLSLASVAEWNQRSAAPVVAFASSTAAAVAALPLEPAVPEEGGGAPAPRAGGGASVLCRGEQVLYVMPHGSPRPATVALVHADASPPYYTVCVDGQERSTERNRLLTLAEAGAGQPPPVYAGTSAAASSPADADDEAADEAEGRHPAEAPGPTAAAAAGKRARENEDGKGPAARTRARARA